jgi:hypothetical protein
MTNPSLQSSTSGEQRVANQIEDLPANDGAEVLRDLPR